MSPTLRLIVTGFRRAARAVHSVAFPFSVALAGLTLGLIILGGIVHNTGSSLACPDWPLCNGTAFPKMAGAILIEHGHRLTALAVVVGTLLILIGLAEGSRDRGAVKVAGLAMALVIVQALLGAITVKFRLPPLVSTGHLATSMLFLSTVIYLAFRLRPKAAPALSPRVQQLTLTATVLIYAQMVLGAAVRHLGAGLVCRELVSCSGWLGADLTMQLHMAHRIFAAVVLGFVLYTSVVAFRASRSWLAIAAPLIVVVQMSLGLLTILTYRDIVPLTAHLAVAGLLLADVLALHLLSRGPLVSREVNEEPVGVAVTA
jgi:heme A synthase